MSDLLVKNGDGGVQLRRPSLQFGFVRGKCRSLCLVSDSWVSRWRVVALITSAQWLAVSVFEAVIDLPKRLADAPAIGVFGKGSPARFHIPAAPIILGSAVSALITNRRASAGRGTLVAAFAATASAAAVTGAAIATVNVPLLEGRRESDKERLVQRWHRLNILRVALIVASMALSVVSANHAMGPGHDATDTLDSNGAARR